MATPAPDRSSRAARLALEVVLVYVVVSLFAGALLTAARFDDRVLEADLFELSWKLQLPWRAAHGEWSGRDFLYPLGPLFQLLTWIGAGFRFRSPGAVLAGQPVAFAAVGLALSAWIAWSTIAHPWRRLLAFTVLTLAVLWSEATTVRAMSLLVVALLYAPREAGLDEDRPSIGRAAAAALALSLASLISYDRGVMGLAGVVLAASYEVVGRLLQRRRLAPAALRLGQFLACLVAWQLVLAGLAALWGASLPEYYARQRELAGSFALGMAIPYDPRAIEGPIGLFVGVAGLAALFAFRPAADLPSGMWLVALVPSLVTALVRSDTAHTWMAIAPAGLAVLVVSLRAADRRRWTAWPAGLLAALCFAGWFGAHPEPLVARSPLALVSAVNLSQRTPPNGARYAGTITRVLDFARARKAAGDPCLGAYQGGDVLHALADLPGPTETLVRWSTHLQAALARAIERQRCPFFVQRLFSFDHREAGAWAIGPDFLAIARLYEADHALGPEVWALRLRGRPAPESVSDVPAEGLGERREVPVPGHTEVRLARPIDSTHLVEIDYTVEMSGLLGYVDGIPAVFVEYFAGEDEVPFSRVGASWGGLNRRATFLLPVHSTRAEERWLLGVEPRQPRAIDRIRLTLITETDTTPARVGLTVHAVRDVAPGGAARPPAPTCDAAIDLVEETLAGRALPRGARLGPGGPGLFLHSNPFPERQAEVFVPAQPCEDTCLRARLDMAPGVRGDGVRFQVHILEGEVRTLLLDRHFAAGDAPVDVEFPLAPWARRPVLVRLGVEPNASADSDWAIFREARVGPCATRLIATELARGRARALDSSPALQGTADLFLHPNGPSDAPARVVYPLRPAATSCFLATVRLRPAPGPSDGVTFVGDLEVDGVRHPLFAIRAAPGEPPVDVRIPLAAWAGRDATLAIGTLSGPSAEFDWAIFEAPRVGDCPR